MAGMSDTEPLGLKHTVGYVDHCFIVNGELFVFPQTACVDESF